jgi:hypothetical protein
MYHCPSGTTTDQIPQRMRMGSLANFYRGYSEASAIKILRSVLVQLAKLQATETRRATSQLTIGAFYFAMRSCEST